MGVDKFPSGHLGVTYIRSIRQRLRESCIWEDQRSQEVPQTTQRGLFTDFTAGFVTGLNGIVSVWQVWFKSWQLCELGQIA